MVRFWSSSGPRHIFHLIRSVPSIQQTQHTSRPIADSRRKSEHISEMCRQSKPEKEVWAHSQNHFCPSHSSRVWTWAKTFCGSVAQPPARRCSTRRRPRPLQQRPSMKSSASTSDTAQQQDYPIYEISYAARSSPHFKYYNAPTRRLLWIVAGIIAWRSQQSRALSGRLWKNHNVRIMLLWKSVISAPINYNAQVFIH